VKERPGHDRGMVDGRSRGAARQGHAIRLSIMASPRDSLCHRPDLLRGLLPTLLPLTTGHLQQLFQSSCPLRPLYFRSMFSRGSRKRDRREIFIKIHELLISDSIQRGGYLLFEKVTDEESVRRLAAQEYR
jgi:hypothetical protein